MHYVKITPGLPSPLRQELFLRDRALGTLVGTLGQAVFRIEETELASFSGDKGEREGISFSDAFEGNERRDPSPSKSSRHQLLCRGPDLHVL